MGLPGCYSGSILRVDLSSGRVARSDTADYQRFVGGRGLGAKLYWDDVPAGAAPFDPENALVFVTGPLTGIPGFGSARWQVYAKSPVADRQGFSYCNVGGTWGVALKANGFDALVVRGKADRPVYLVVDDEGAEIRDASHLSGKGAIQTRQALKSELGAGCHVVAIGPAGENGVVTAVFLGEKDASGSAGFGAVMGAKGLKAIVLREGHRRLKVAHPDRLQEAIRHLRSLTGSDSRIEPPIKDANMRPDHCSGCPGPCIRFAYRSADGKEGKFMCQASSFYQQRAQAFYQDHSNEVAFLATNLCNDYGIDTVNLEAMLAWLVRCRRAGVLDDRSAGLPLSQVGSREFFQTLLHKISFREGIGDLLANGVVSAAASLGPIAQEQIGDLIHKPESTALYGPRMYIPNGLIYAMEPRQALSLLHEVSLCVDAYVDWVKGKEGAYVSGALVRAAAKRFWGSEQAADFTTYEGKALAAKMIQDRTYAKESLILCDLMWPVMFSRHTEDQLGDPTLESRLVSAVTGWDVDEQDLNRVGARALVLQRAILHREGHRGREDDSLPAFCFDTPLKVHFVNADMIAPGPEGAPICRRGAVVDPEQFERMKDEYYRERHWDPATGLPTAAQMAEASRSLID